jgi:hypothetical protein
MRDSLLMDDPWPGIPAADNASCLGTVQTREYVSDEPWERRLK